MIALCDHPLLDAPAFVTTFPKPLGELEPAGGVTALLSHDTAAPMTTGDEVKKAIRDMLRHGGFKPAGRSKPASEYLLKAAQGGFLGPINAAVDPLNAVSLHSGLPISVVDLDLIRGDLRVEIAPQGASYIFNASGQTIDLGGLVCLMDDQGPCANAVKDSQRTKTSEGTTRTLSILWGSTALTGRAEEARAWYQRLLVEGYGAAVEPA